MCNEYKLYSTTRLDITSMSVLYFGAFEREMQCVSMVARVKI